MEAKALIRYLRISPRKVRIVANAIRGKYVDEAFNILNFARKRSVVPIKKLLNSAIANARTKGDLDLDRAYVKEIYVDEGPTMKRFLPRAMGRATKIQKKTSHVTIVVDEA